MIEINDIIPKLFNEKKIKKLSNKKIFIFTITFQWINYLLIIASILHKRGNRINFYYNTVYDQDTDFFKNRLSKKKLNEIENILNKYKIKNFKSVNIFSGRNKKIKLGSIEKKIINDQSIKDTIRITKDVINNPNKKYKKIFFERVNRNTKTFIYFNELLKKNKPDAIIIPNATYYEWSIAYQLARKNNIKCITLENFRALDDKNLVMDTNYPAAKFDQNNVESYWKNKSKIVQRKDLLKDFYNFQDLTIQKNNKKNQNLNKVFNLNSKQKKILMTSSFPWENHPRLKRYCFNSQGEWIQETIKFLSKHDDVTIFFKCHPYPSLSLRQASNYKKSSSNPFYYIKKFYNHKNLKIIGPESDLHINDLLDYCDVCITYHSMSGLEACLKGKKTIICTNYNYANKPFVITPKNEMNYFKLLEQNILRVNKFKPSKKVKDQSLLYLNMIYNNYPFAFPYKISLPYFNFNLFNINNFSSFYIGKSEYGKTISYLEGTNYKNFINFKKFINSLSLKETLLFPIVELRSIVQHFINKKLYQKKLFNFIEFLNNPFRVKIKTLLYLFIWRN